MTFWENYSFFWRHGNLPPATVPCNHQANKAFLNGGIKIMKSKLFLSTMLFAAAAAFCASLSFTAPADKNAHLAEGEQIQVAYLGGIGEYETD